MSAIIGDFTRKIMLDGKHTPKQCVDAVLEEFPGSACDEKHIAWYKWDMKRKGNWPDGYEMPSGRKAVAKRKPAAKKTKPPVKKRAAPKRKAAPRKKRATKRQPAVITV